MTNKEFYKEQILYLVCEGSKIAINKDTQMPCKCENVHCNTCLLYGDSYNCRQTFSEWCKAEYVKPCPFKKDELVEVSQNGVDWLLRHFCKLENEMYYCYENGKTSTNSHCTQAWRYCRKYGTLGGLIKETEE